MMQLQENRKYKVLKSKSVNTQFGEKTILMVSDGTEEFDLWANNFLSRRASSENGPWHFQTEYKSEFRNKEGNLMPFMPVSAVQA